MFLEIEGQGLKHKILHRQSKNLVSEGVISSKRPKVLPRIHC
jgi:hypothetical protein